MVLTLPPFFPHTRNRDGSFDSICLKCLHTIANAGFEADLEAHDEDHVCNRFHLVPTGFRSRSDSALTNPALAIF